MGFNPSHCEECGNAADEYFVDGPFVVCGVCARPDIVEEAREKTLVLPHRRYPGQTNRERNVEIRDDYLEETSCACGEYQPHYLKFYRDGKIASDISRLVDDGVAIETLQAAMEECVVECQACRTKNRV